SLAQLAPGESVAVSAAWTPAAGGTYLIRAQVDPDGLIEEAQEANNDASRSVFVSTDGALAVELQADRTAYAAHSDALVRVSLTNGGTDFDGTVETTVEDAAGNRIATLDARSLTLAYGSSEEFQLVWNTGAVYAGSYAFHLRATDGGGALRAQAALGFTILP